MLPDLSIDFCGIRSPNPFWLASGPPSNSADQVRRAFQAGWGGAVWKTMTDELVVNVSSRYGAIDCETRRVVGLNNIELISDRSLDDNLAEIRQIKAEFPDRPVIASIMVGPTREAWHKIVRQSEDAGVDGLELNFGCPHGMSERGMGSAVGQVPEYTEMMTAWAKEVAQTPVIAKLTPNVTDIRPIGQAAKNGGADGLSLINTINSIMGVDLDTLLPRPHVAGRGAHGGYCGPAVKPIALNMVTQLRNDPEIRLPISGIGGIETWQDAAEFLLLGSGSVQLCTAVMHFGFGIIEELIAGLQGWMQEKGFSSIYDLVGLSASRIGEWGDLDLAYKVVADIDQSKCIHCGRCHVACQDGCHQSICREDIAIADFVGPNDMPPEQSEQESSQEQDGYIHIYTVDTDKCVGCNMCSLICPVEGCITMKPVDSGQPSMSWNEYQQKVAQGEIEPMQPKRRE